MTYCPSRTGAVEIRNDSKRVRRVAARRRRSTWRSGYTSTIWWCLGERFETKYCLEKRQTRCLQLSAERSGSGSTSTRARVRAAPPNLHEHSQRSAVSCSRGRRAPASAMLQTRTCNATHGAMMQACMMHACKLGSSQVQAPWAKPEQQKSKSKTEETESEWRLLALRVLRRSAALRRSRVYTCGRSLPIVLALSGLSLGRNGAAGTAHHGEAECAGMTGHRFHRLVRSHHLLTHLTSATTCQSRFHSICHSHFFHHILNLFTNVLQDRTSVTAAHTRRRASPRQWRPREKTRGCPMRAFYETRPRPSLFTLSRQHSAIDRHGNRKFPSPAPTR